MKELELVSTDLRPGDCVNHCGHDDLLEIQEIESMVDSDHIIVRFVDGNYAEIKKTTIIKPVYRNGN